MNNLIPRSSLKQCYACLGEEHGDIHSKHPHEYKTEFMLYTVNQKPDNIPSLLIITIINCPLRLPHKRYKEESKDWRESIGFTNKDVEMCA